MVDIKKHRKKITVWEVNNKLTVLSDWWYKISKWWKKHKLWTCKCECWQVKTIISSNFRNSISCWLCSNPVNIWSIFWKLKVVSKAENHIKPSWWSMLVFVCQCECGKETKVLKQNLINWHTSSCWCGMIKHWMCNHELYGVWDDMKRRCNNPQNKYYKDYWWRWITYCEERESIHNFIEDMHQWYAKWLSLDRINNNWNYEPSNCRWATTKQQSRNKRTSIMYQWKCLADRAEDIWMNYPTLSSRIKRWYSFERAITQDVQKRTFK